MTNLKKCIENIFFEENIDCYASVALEDCKIIRKYLLEREGIGEKGTVFLFAVPYYNSHCNSENRNISVYATGWDYHLFFSDLYNRILPLIKSLFPNNKFAAYCDHSPIDEVGAAALGGMGIIGKNHLLITEKYSSFVFIGEIVTDAVEETEKTEIHLCENCGLCKKHCPVDLSREECLSALTQKKGELTEAEKEKIIELGSAWGCDICQNVCPHTIKAKERGTIYSSLRFFCENCNGEITLDAVRNMSDEEFAKRAYSFRGKQTVIRNLELLEGTNFNLDRK